MSFAYHTPLAKTSSGILNKSGESGPHAGTWSLWGTFGYSPLSVAVTTGLSYILFIMLSMIPSSLNTPVTLLWSWRDVGFYQRPFLYLLRWSCGFYTNCIYWFMCVEPSCVTVMKTMWSWLETVAPQASHRGDWVLTHGCCGRVGMLVEQLSPKVWEDLEWTKDPTECPWTAARGGGQGQKPLGKLRC